jgi:hypothetical protein
MIPEYRESKEFSGYEKCHFKVSQYPAARELFHSLVTNTNLTFNMHLSHVLNILEVDLSKKACLSHFVETSYKQ